MKKCVLNVCQAGNELLCAGYTLYSSSTILVLTVGKGVWGFTFDPLIGEFILSHPNIRIPDKGGWGRQGRGAANVAERGREDGGERAVGCPGQPRASLSACLPAACGLTPPLP